MKKSRIILGIGLVLIIANIFVLQSAADSPWPFYHGYKTQNGLSIHDTSKNNGKVLWGKIISDEIDGGVTIDDNGIIYVADYSNGKLYAFNPNGSIKWKVTINSEVGVSSTPAIGGNGVIYIGDVDGYLHAISPEGTEIWKTQISNEILGSSAIIDNNTIYIGSYTGKPGLFALDSNGNIKWSYITHDGIDVPPSIGLDDTIYVGDTQGYLYALNPNGSLKWSLKLGSEIDTTAAVTTNSIYVGSDKNVYCISLNGEIIWSFKAGDNVESSPAIGLDGTIYFGCNGEYLYALKPNGELKWKFQTTGAIYTSSPSIGADGTIYIGDENGHLFAVNPDGSKKWETVVREGDDIQSPIAIDMNGTIYVTTWEGGIYAIGSGSSGGNTQQQEGNTPPINPPETPSPSIAFVIILIVISAILLERKRR